MHGIRTNHNIPHKTHHISLAHHTTAPSLSTHKCVSTHYGPCRTYTKRKELTHVPRPTITGRNTQALAYNNTPYFITHLPITVKTHSHYISTNKHANQCHQRKDCLIKVEQRDTGTLSTPHNQRHVANFSTFHTPEKRKEKNMDNYVVRGANSAIYSASTNNISPSVKMGDR